MAVSGILRPGRHCSPLRHSGKSRDPEPRIPGSPSGFYRVSVKDSRAHGGTGLGIAIVKQTLNRHRSKLKIESAAGKGSTFTGVHSTC